MARKKSSLSMKLSMSGTTLFVRRLFRQIPIVLLDLHFVAVRRGVVVLFFVIASALVLMLLLEDSPDRSLDDVAIRPLEVKVLQGVVSTFDAYQVELPTTIIGNRREFLEGRR